MPCKKCGHRSVVRRGLCYHCLSTDDDAKYNRETEARRDRFTPHFEAILDHIRAGGITPEEARTLTGLYTTLNLGIDELRIKARTGSLAIDHHGNTETHNGRYLEFDLRAKPSCVSNDQHIELINDVRAALAREAANWAGDNLDTAVTVCGPIRHTGKGDDCVALSLTAKNGAPAIYLRVHGWTEDKD